MNLRLSLAALIAFSIAVASSDARPRNHGSSGAAESSCGGGPLTQDRGLSQNESAAVGTVLGEVAGGSATAGRAPTVVAPSRRLSPDYWRVYSQRLHSGGGGRVAVAPAQKKPVAAAPTPAPRTRHPAVAAAPAPKTRAAAAAPAPVTASSNGRVRALFATGPVAGAPTAPKPRTAVAPPPTPVAPPRTAGRPVRTVFASPLVSAKPPAPVAPQTSGAAPNRVLFRD